MKEATLNDKQLRFCEEYLIDLNATQAAIRAGYSQKTANEQASQLLAKLSIQEKVAELMRARSKRTEITADRVLQEVARIAYSNMRDYAEFGPDGIRFKDSADLTDEQMALISELSQETKEFKGQKTTSTKFKLYCKDTALYTLMRHLGLYEKDNAQGALKFTITMKKKDGSAGD